MKFVFVMCWYWPLVVSVRAFRDSTPSLAVACDEAISPLAVEVVIVDHRLLLGK